MPIKRTLTLDGANTEVNGLPLKLAVAPVTPATTCNAGLREKGKKDTISALSSFTFRTTIQLYVLNQKLQSKIGL